MDLIHGRQSECSSQNDIWFAFILAHVIIISIFGSVRGASLFHWAAGCGNLEGLKELVDGVECLESRLQVTRTGNSTTPKNPGVHAALVSTCMIIDLNQLHTCPNHSC